MLRLDGNVGAIGDFEFALEVDCTSVSPGCSPAPGSTLQTCGSMVEVLVDELVTCQSTLHLHFHMAAIGTHIVRGLPNVAEVRDRHHRRGCFLALKSRHLDFLYQQKTARQIEAVDLSTEQAKSVAGSLLLKAMLSAQEESFEANKAPTLAKLGKAQESKRG